MREAFRMLEEAGLVRTEKNRGVFVRDVPIEEALEIFEVRAAMDTTSAASSPRPSAGRSCSEIAPLVDAMDRAAKAGTRPTTTCSTCSSTTAWSAGGQRKADRDLPQADQGAAPVPAQEPGRRLAVPISAREHRQIVKAIAAGDAEAAGQAMYEHVMNSRARTLRNHEKSISS